MNERTRGESAEAMTIVRDSVKNFLTNDGMGDVEASIHVVKREEVKQSPVSELTELKKLYAKLAKKNIELVTRCEDITRAVEIALTVKDDDLIECRKELVKTQDELVLLQSKIRAFNLSETLDAASPYVKP